jgi:hypothetical protein
VVVEFVVVELQEKKDQLGKRLVVLVEEGLID